MKTYRGPIPMSRIDDTQLRTVAEYHAYVNLEPARGWNLSQLTMAYRIRGQIVVNELKKVIAE